MRGDEARLQRHTRRFIYNGLSVIIGALAIGGVGSVALSLVAENLRETPEASEGVAPLALWCIEHRSWLAGLAIPPLLAGVWLLMGRRRGGPGWLTFSLAMLWLFALFGLVLYSFIMFLAPLYQYQAIE